MRPRPRNYECKESLMLETADGAPFEIAVVHIVWHTAAFLRLPSCTLSGTHAARTCIEDSCWSVPPLPTIRRVYTDSTDLLVPDTGSPVSMSSGCLSPSLAGTVAQAHCHITANFFLLIAFVLSCLASSFPRSRSDHFFPGSPYW